MSLRWDRNLIDSLPIENCTDEDVIKIVRKAKAEGVRLALSTMMKQHRMDLAEQLRLTTLAAKIEGGEA